MATEIPSAAMARAAQMGLGRLEARKVEEA